MVKEFPLSVRIAACVFVILVTIYILSPLVVVIGVAVSENQYVAFPPSGFSLRWFASVFRSNDYVNALLVSLQLAALTTIISAVVGGAAAIALHRKRLPGSAIFGLLFLSPLILPTIIFAIGLLMLWSTVIGAPSFWALLLGHVAVTLPYVIRTTLAVLADSDPFLEEAARTMGARRWQRIIHVVIPQCMPGLVAGAFLAFNVSFDETTLALFLRTPDLTTLPVQIYNQLEFSADPTVAAVSAILIGITIAMMVLMDRFLGIQRFA